MIKKRLLVCMSSLILEAMNDVAVVVMCVMAVAVLLLVVGGGAAADFLIRKTCRRR
jgi:hypothetical protein